MRNPIRHLRRQLTVSLLYIFYSLLPISAGGGGGGDLWPLDRPEGMPSIQSLEVMCGKDHMDVHLTFSQPFEGIVSSKGQHGDPRCVYVPPSTGQTFFSFRIAYARCGTKPDLHGQFYENTVVVQYDKDLLEVWDEAKRLRCEWFNDYEKTASKPPMVIADLDVIQLDFRGDNVDCWMEIQHGKGPWAPPVSGIVPLGSTLTLVVAINDYRGEFDMRVKSCIASDGGGHIIQLSDESGCVLRPKMISRFLKARGADERASVITYAFFHAFKFPDALSVHIKCKVEICRHGCLDHCQLQPEKGTDFADLAGLYGGGPLERKDDDKLDHKDEEESEEDSNNEDGKKEEVVNEDKEEDVIYDDIIHRQDQDESNPAAIKMSLDMSNKDSNNKKMMEKNKKPLDDTSNSAGDGDVSEDLEITALPHKQDIYMTIPQEQFPHGPRTFEDKPVASPRSMKDEDTSGLNLSSMERNKSTNSKEPNKVQKRRKRNVVVSDRKARSADVGVSGLYEVISEADLAFSPDSKAEAVTVFQGRIREEVVYGICMPVPGFSVLFVLVAVSAVVSALVAGTLLYRYQLQKEHIVEQQQSNQRSATNASIPMNLLSNFMGLRLLRMRTHNSVIVPAPSAAGTSPSTSGPTSINGDSLVMNGKN